MPGASRDTGSPCCFIEICGEKPRGAGNQWCFGQELKRSPIKMAEKNICCFCGKDEIEYAHESQRLFVLVSILVPTHLGGEGRFCN
jgi:hypothetical protein